MKKIITYFVALFITVFTLQAEQIKLLAIGNSFSDDAIEHYLYDIAYAAGDTIIIGNMYIGGCSLERHYNNSINNSPNYSYRKIVDGVKQSRPIITSSMRLVMKSGTIFLFSKSARYRVFTILIFLT